MTVGLSFFLSLSSLLVFAPAARVVATGAAVALVAPADTTVVFTGALVCPDAQALGAALTGLLPARHEGEGPDVLQLSRHGDSVELRLVDATGTLIGEKRLPAGGSCEERAQLVAVTVAAWEAHWRPEPPPALPRLAVPVAVAPEPPPPAPVRLAPVTTVAIDEDEPHSSAPIELETRAGLLLSLASGTAAPAATADVGYSRRGSSYGLAVGVLAVGNHDTPVGPASARWRRVGGTIDLRSRLPVRAFVLEMHAAAALTALSVSGASIPVTSNATLFDPGALVGLRGQVRLKHVAPWLEATAAFWPATHTAYLNGSTAATDLPSFELLLGAGVAFGAAP